MRDYSLFYNSDDLAEQYTVSLSAKTIALPAVGSILSTLLATIISSAIVLRTKPLRLLQKT